MPPSGQRGADHQGVGAVTGQHRVLRPLSVHESPCCTARVTFRVGLRVAGFQVGEGQQPLAGGDIVQ